MKAQVSPTFCALAIICKVKVVLPLLSGPYISTILPLGTPPTPKALSIPKEPVE